MHVVRAATLLALAVPLALFSAYWMVLVATDPTPMLGLPDDTMDSRTFGRILGATAAVLLPSALSGLAFHGALRQLRRHGLRPRNRSSDHLNTPPTYGTS